jgi:hypothetical protein
MVRRKFPNDWMQGGQNRQLFLILNGSELWVEDRILGIWLVVGRTVGRIFSDGIGGMISIQEIKYPPSRFHFYKVCKNFMCFIVF